MKARVWMDDDELWYVSVWDESMGWYPLNKTCGCWTKWGAKRLAKRYKKIHERSKNSGEHFEI